MICNQCRLKVRGSSLIMVSLQCLSSHPYSFHSPYGKINYSISSNKRPGVVWGRGRGREGGGVEIYTSYKWHSLDLLWDNLGGLTPVLMEFGHFLNAKCESGRFIGRDVY